MKTPDVMWVVFARRFYSYKMDMQRIDAIHVNDLRAAHLLRNRECMPYEDPMEAALRALTGVEWTKRKDGFEARVNKTTLNAIQLELSDHKIQVVCEPSSAQTGRYIVKVSNSELPFIQRAMKVTGAEIKPHRRKRQS